MRRLGIYLMLFGLATIILPFFERQLVIFSWIDSWGETVSWIIKIGLLVVGAVLFFMEKPAEDVIEAPTQEESAE